MSKYNSYEDFKYKKYPKKQVFKRKSEFQSLSSIITNVADNVGINRGLSEIEFVKNWPKIVGDKFKDNSKAIKVTKKYNHDVLMVAVKSSVVSQELFMFKKDILNKLKPIALNYGFRLNDINFSTHLWEDAEEIERKKEKHPKTEIFIKNPSDKELENIAVPINELDKIKKSLEKDNLLPEIKEKMYNTIIRDLKTDLWKKQNGFPVCENCGVSVSIFNKNEKVLCPSCKY